MPALPPRKEAGKETPGRIRLLPPSVRIPVSDRHLPAPSIDGLEGRPLKPPPAPGRVIHHPHDDGGICVTAAGPDDGPRGARVVERPQAREVSPPAGRRRRRPVLARFRLSGAGSPPVVVESVAVGMFRRRGDGVLVEPAVRPGTGTGAGAGRAGEARVKVLSSPLGRPFLVAVDVGIPGALPRALAGGGRGWCVLHLLVDDVHGDGPAVGPVLEPVPLVLGASSLGWGGAPAAAFGYGEPGREEEDDEGCRLHFSFSFFFSFRRGALVTDFGGLCRVGMWCVGDLLGEFFFPLHRLLLVGAWKQGREGK